MWWDKNAVPLKKCVEEPLHHPSNSIPQKFLSTESENLVSSQPQFSIRSHHGSVAGAVGLSVVPCVMMLTVNLKDNTHSMRQ